MKTKTVELKNQSTSEVFEIITVSLNKDFIKVADIIEQNDVPYFLELPAGNLVNLLDLTGVMPYEIWYLMKTKGLWERPSVYIRDRAVLGFRRRRNIYCY